MIFPLVLLTPCEEFPTDCPGVVSCAGDVAYSALLCRADLPYPAALVSAPDGPDGGGEPKSTEAPGSLERKVGEGLFGRGGKFLWCTVCFFFWDEQHNLGESFFLNRSVFGFCLSKVSRICFCWFWGWHMFFSLAATGWKGKVPEWPQFIPHSVWFLLTSFNVWNFQPLVCWWWFSTPRNLERFPQETYHEIAITDHQSDYRHLGGVIGFRPPKTHRLNYIDNQNKTPEY